MKSLRNALFYSRYLSLSKIVNLIRFKRDLSKRAIVTNSYPSFIQVQPSGFCNSNCQLCPVGINLPGPSGGFMKMETFRKVVDGGRDYLINIFFGDWGEPFLNRNIYDMIGYAEANRISTSISTNLHHFKTEDDLRKILTSELSGGLIISLHGVSEESYSAYQPGKSYYDVLNKIKLLVKVKKELKIKRPDIKLMFAISKKNQHEISAMKKLSSDLGLPYKMYSASINARYFLNDRQKLSDLINEWAQDGAYEESENDINENKNKIADFYKELHAEGGLDFKALEKKGITGRHFCMDPWKTAVVSWNGDISLCCVDYLKYKMGNINEASLKQIWNSAEYINVRRYFINPSAVLPLGHPCRKCLLY